MSPMKLQKILYYAHGWNLGLGLGPLIDDQVEAWPWGPVIPTVYHEFKRFGTDPIKSHRWSRLDATKGEDGKIRFRAVRPSLDECPGNVDVAKEVIRRVWDVYKPYTAVQLSNMTHKPGTPWDTVWNKQGGKDRRSTDIPDEVIREHFAKLVTPGAKA